MIILRIGIGITKGLPTGCSVLYEWKNIRIDPRSSSQNGFFINFIPFWFSFNIILPDSSRSERFYILHKL